MTPLEKAARAMVKVESGEDCYDALDEAQQQAATEAFKAGLLAMRDPDPVMAAAGAQVVRKVHSEDGHEAFEGDAANVWRAMIDAAG